MDIIMDTVKNLAFYLIFTTVIKNLIADTHYAKYADFFMGLVLILILTGPLAKIMKLNGTFEEFINREEFRIDLEDARNELYAGEDDRNDQILKHVENTMKEQIEKIAEKETLHVSQVKLRLSTKDEAFGDVEKIEIWLSDGEDKIEVKKIRLGEEENAADNYASFVEDIEEFYQLEKGAVSVYEE